MKKVIVAVSLFVLVYGLGACSNSKEIKDKQYYSEGLYLYQKYCQNCHMDNGQGLGNLIPPLAGSDYLTKKTSDLACVIKHGLKGKLTVNKKEYEGIMPANAGLSTIEIAEIVTYITNSWGNKQPVYTIKQVEEDLKKCP